MLAQLSYEVITDTKTREHYGGQWLVRIYVQVTPSDWTDFTTTNRLWYIPPSCCLVQQWWQRGLTEAKRFRQLKDNKTYLCLDVVKFLYITFGWCTVYIHCVIYQSYICFDEYRIHLLCQLNLLVVPVYLLWFCYMFMMVFLIYFELSPGFLYLYEQKCTFMFGPMYVFVYKSLFRHRMSL